MPEPPAAPGEGPVLQALDEGRRLEAYAEQQTREMRVCFLCERVVYRRLPVRKIGRRWICIDCVRELKELLENLDHWEHLAVLSRGEPPRSA
jgi:hypothetical protein